MKDRFYTFATGADFGRIEARIQFYAAKPVVDQIYQDAYFKWNIEGLGEAYGFWFRLAGSERPFIVKTLVQVGNILDDAVDEPIEWMVDAASVADAKAVYKGMGLPENLITWIQGES